MDRLLAKKYWRNIMTTPIEYVYVPVDNLTDKSIYELVVRGEISGRLKKVPITELVGDAVEFAEWVDSNAERLSKNTWRIWDEGARFKPDTKKWVTKTTAELYQLFKSKQ